jgi:hypothetical protein
MKTNQKFYGVALALACGLPITLEAQNLYVGSFYGGTVGEYNLDGSTINPDFISGPDPFGIDIVGNDLFVGLGSNIAEYTTAGTLVNAALASQLNNPQDIAVSGTNLFVLQQNSNFNNAGVVGKYTTSGVTINANLITGLGEPVGIAVSGNDLFVANYYSGTIGEYGFDGSVVNASLISGLSGPWGLAIVGNNLYVANQRNNTIGEYTTSGATINTDLISGLNGPQGIAVWGNDIYVANTYGASVGEYTLSGGTVNASLISGLNSPVGIAVGVVPEPSTVALSGLGGVALWAWRRRKQSSSISALRT